MISHRLLPLAVAIAVAAALAGVGCGGGDDNAATDPASTATSVTPSGSEPLDVVAGELEAAGMSTFPEDPGPGAQAAISAGPRSNQRWVAVEYFADPKQAVKVGDEIEAVYTELVGQGLVQVDGKILVQIGSAENLTPEEEDAFLSVLAVVEGE